MTKILVASTPVYGHFAPMRSIARHLVQSGHDVTFLTGEQYRSQVEAVGADFVPLTGLAGYNAERPAGEFVELAARRNAMPAGHPDRRLPRSRHPRPGCLVGLGAFRRRRPARR
jgi:UDP:flavonoid glycosyltransferase YjiC (YdhE family)